jgi:hypothetical protein
MVLVQGISLYRQRIKDRSFILFAPQDVWEVIRALLYDEETEVQRT